MERFKVCERESKTKTFSKEGLSLQATKVDPAQARRNDARDWITATVSTLEEECEAFEAEVESLGGGSGVGGGGDSKGGGGGGGGRRGKAKAIPPRVTHLEASADRHRAHVARLEQLLRLLDNEAIEVEDVEGVRELVDDIVTVNEESISQALLMLIERAKLVRDRHDVRAHIRIVPESPTVTFEPPKDGLLLALLS